MGRTPAELGERVSRLLERRAGRFKWASRYVKGAFILVGALVSGVAQFAQVPQGQSPSTVQVAGMAASLLVFLGGLFVLIIDEDASEDLVTARAATEAARDALEAVHVLEGRDETLKRVTSLYLAMAEMRRVIERAVTAKLALTATIRLMFVSAERLLAVAAGFAQSDRWTLCIYKAFEDPAGGRDYLVCVDHARAIKCDVAKARRWAEGVGVAGIAYATRQDIVVPNMHTFGIGSLFNVAGQTRDYDQDRYRTTAAFPIRVDGMPKPWGVVVATNDRYDHFNLDEGPGLQTSEAVRLVSSMMALAVSVCLDDVKEPEAGEGSPSTAAA